MPANNAGLNLTTRAGEGAANILQWGNLDRAANQLYQEQRQREQRGYNDYLAGEQALQKEFANVRSADVPDVVAAYHDRKRTRQQILFDEKIKNDPIQLAKKQQEFQIKDAQLRQLISGSQELKDIDKGINARKISHIDDFDAERVKEHANDLNLSLRERMKLGRLDATPYLYQGTNTDFGKLSKAAQGPLQTLPFGSETMTPDKWQFEQKQISRYNNPVQYADNMYKALQQRRAGQDAARLLNKLSPSDISKIQTEFDAIPEKEFEDRWGVKKDALLNGVLPDDKAGQYVLLDAMKYATMNMPKDVASKFRDNDEFKRQASYDDWAKKYGIAEADRRLRQQRSFAQQDKWMGAANEEGNAFTTFGAATPLKLRLPSGKEFGVVSGGFVTDLDGKPITGRFKIDRANVPSAIRGLLKAGGLNPDDIDNKVEIIYSDGKINGVDFGADIGVIDEQTLKNFQLKANTEPLKGKQPTYGKQNTPPTAPVKKETKTFVFPGGKTKF